MVSQSVLGFPLCLRSPSGTSTSTCVTILCHPHQFLRISAWGAKAGLSSGALVGGRRLAGRLAIFWDWGWGYRDWRAYPLSSYYSFLSVLKKKGHWNSFESQIFSFVTSEVRNIFPHLKKHFRISFGYWHRLSLTCISSWFWKGNSGLFFLLGPVRFRVGSWTCSNILKVGPFLKDGLKVQYFLVYRILSGFSSVLKEDHLNPNMLWFVL